MMRRPIAIVALALAAAGCGKPAEQPRRTEMVVDRRAGERAVTVTGPQGRTTIRTGSAAAALPAGLPLFPGARLTSSTAMDGDSAARSGTVLSFESTAAAADVVGFYRAAASRAGYAIDAEIAARGMAMLSGRRAQRHFNLTVTDAAGRSSATLIGG